MQAKPIVLLVGPHRSGTPFLTQVVSVIGFDLGKTLMLPSFDNPRGFWENQKLVEVHDELLSSFGKDWTTITSLRKNWLDDPKVKKTEAAIIDILESDFRPKEAWLIKDPRLCLLYPIWENIGKTLNRPIKLITIVRSPQATSQSMQVRNKLNPEDADVIALSYLQAMTNNLKSVIGESFVYENIIQLNGEEITKLIFDALDMDTLDSNKNLEAQIERLVLDTSDKVVKNTPIHKIYTETVGRSATIAKGTLQNLVSSLIGEPMLTAFKNVSGKETLLDLSQQPVSLTQAELDQYKFSYEENEGLRKMLNDQSDEIKVLKNQESEALISLHDELGRLSGGIRERDELIKNAKLELSELQQAFDVKMLDSLNEREKLEKQKSKLEHTLKKSKAQLAAKKKALTEFEKAREQETQLQQSKEKEFKNTEKRMKSKIKRTEANISKKTSVISQLNLEIEEITKTLNVSEASLKIERGTREDVEAKLAEITRLKEMQDTTIELDAIRYEMVQATLNSRVSDLEEKIMYFEKAPLKAGVKKVAFSTLRELRRGLPLPETTKLTIAKKLTNVARRLQPPQLLSMLPEPTQIESPAQIDFAFSETENPIISIVVPVYNEISQTIACLKSIYQQTVNVEYEVILADDKSPDPFHTILKQVPGLRYFRNEENLHFLRNCNRNAAHARGEYIVFLNNDTIVKPGWLQKLLDTFLENDDVGVVGSKLIYPSGDLQEAGAAGTGAKAKTPTILCIIFYGMLTSFLARL